MLRAEETLHWRGLDLVFCFFFILYLISILSFRIEINIIEIKTYIFGHAMHLCSPVRD